MTTDFPFYYYILGAASLISYVFFLILLYPNFKSPNLSQALNTQPYKKLIIGYASSLLLLTLFFIITLSTIITKQNQSDISKRLAQLESNLSIKTENNPTPATQQPAKQDSYNHHEIVSAANLEKQISSIVSALYQINQSISSQNHQTEKTEINNFKYFILIVLIIAILAIVFFSEESDPNLKRLKAISKYLSVLVGMAICIITLHKEIAELVKSIREAIHVGKPVSTQPTTLIPVFNIPLNEHAKNDIMPINILNTEIHFDRIGTTVLVPFNSEASCIRENGTSIMTGVTPGNLSTQFLNWLGNSLKECAITKAKKQINITVTGFASSSELKTDAALSICNVDSHKSANLKFANERRRQIIQLLNASCGSYCNYDESGEWPNYEDMVKARRYNDRTPSGEYDLQKGILNRRAEIRIDDINDCELFMSTVLLESDTKEL